MSWKQTAKRFSTSWHSVFGAVQYAVEWGKAHRDLDGITSVGVDEPSRAKGQRYFTLAYQLDQGQQALTTGSSEKRSALPDLSAIWITHHGALSHAA